MTPTSLLPLLKGGGVRWGVYIFFFFSLLFFSAVASSSAENAAAQQAYQQGVELKNENRFELAEIQLRKALELDPTQAKYHFELANVYALEYDGASRNEDAGRLLQNAVRELKQAVMYRPDFLPAQFNLGIVYKRLGRYEDARATFKQVLMLDPKNQTAALMQIGATYEEQGFYDDAQSLYEEALEKNGSNPDIQEALENLEKHRSAATHHAQENMAQRFNMLGQSAAYENSGQNPSQNSGSQNLMQAVPYLASLFAPKDRSQKE